MADVDIYDFENILPKAVASVFSAAGLTVYTAASNPELQKTRPRVEVIFKLGTAFSPPVIDPATVVNGAGLNSGRNMGWNGTLNIHAITDADAPGKLVHAQYRAMVRAIAGGLMGQINGNNLPFHKLQNLQEESQTHGIREADGYEQSTITFSAAFTIQFGAWTNLDP